ncbi:phage tail protein [Pseudomonas cremoris]|uniref:phage tail protein n=1 Tax=Pseudomonas cremoris TaxID=2724178 RepID=UPI001E658B1E|nr:phage tail protein [Pseudomonas cremoris]
MGASITLAGENLIAQKQAANAGLKVSRFIFANVPGLNPNAPVDRAAPKPPVGQIVNVHEIPAEHAGYVNPNQVVYSAQIGSDVGDWDFNWIGLETTEGVLFAVAYVPVQQKRRNIPPLQIGNNLTRNFLVAFDGALALTGITIDASTWQHDFTVRLAGIDERERLSNRDVYGRACFFGSSLQVIKVGSAYQLKSGIAYIEGMRLVQSAALPIAPPSLPTTVWLDVVLQRELSDVVASWTLIFGANKADYTDALGVKHYCVAIADLATAGITDRRSVEAIDGPLVQQFALRIGDYKQLRARATTKEDVGLSAIPNAKSDDPNVSDSEILATTKALRALYELIVIGDHLEMRARKTTKEDVGLGKLPNAKSDSWDSDSSDVLATTKLAKKIFDQMPVNGQALFLTAGVSTWNVPAGVKKCWVEVTGGGGGGAFYGSSPGPGGGGGGGVARKAVDLTGINSVVITVGTGGNGSVANGYPGLNGGGSSFGEFCSASGGGGGRVDASTASGGTGTGGDMNTSIGSGNPALSVPSGSFYGGSGAGGESGFASSDPRRPSNPGYGGGGRWAGGGGAPGAHGAVIIRW